MAPRPDADARFRAAVDASADVIHIVDPETMRLVDANETACRHLGYTREEFLRLAIPDFCPGADLGQLRRTYEELFAGDEVAQRARIVHRHRDGRLIRMEIHRRGVVVDGRRLVVNVVRDITEQEKAEQLLRLEHQVARALSESHTVAAGLDAVLHAFCEAEGWERGRYVPGEEEGADAGGFSFPVTAEGRRLGLLSFQGSRAPASDARVLQSAAAIGAQVGQFLQRMRAEAALRESEARFRSLTQMSSDFYWETDPQHRFTQVVHGKNFAESFVTVILGKAAWEIPYTMPDEEGWARLRATVDAHRPFRDFEFGRPTPGGARYLAVSGEPRHDEAGRFLGYRGVGRDITDLVLARERIASLAYSDPLTGLANRTSLAPAFEQALERARRRGARLAALFIDLDGFKAVNDAWGHASGDAFLVETARRLRGGVRASDLVARLGGDEFFAVLEDVQEAAQVQGIAHKLLAEIARPVELAPGRSAAVTGSIGIALFPDDAPDVAGLMRTADAAMYAAKQSGKNAVR